MNNNRITPETLKTRKNPAEPIVCLTAYTTPIAALLDAHCDLLLVGDSLGMVLYGLSDTTQVDIETMIRHGAAVMRGSQQACVVVDMPYGTYENSPEEALTNARRLIAETGCSAVKLEGGVEMAPAIKAIVADGIPVMGHIGLQPQSSVKEGGFKIKGRTDESIQKLLADAKAVEEAGAFSVVIEGTVEPVSRLMTESIGIPTVGIGASPACDGQILVIDDMLGLTPRQPKFVKKYTDLQSIVERAAQDYANDVRARAFPGEAQLYK
ncbi:MAG: 3-methyl-2-oxobutanoate hydroxymethyltransferase [Alphaproteobacteria bacterium]|nr:3-methyl-2-oxobutanoate hydroxymethyltransferase [Alphaproteobacteria bacterium]